MLQCFWAAKMYEEDNDYHFPIADRWIDETEAYASDPSIYSDPSLGSEGSYGFAFRDEASGVSEFDITELGGFILLFTTDIRRRNAHGDLNAMCSLGRGAGGKNLVVVTDGHASLVSRGTVGATKPDWLTEDAKAGPRPHPAQKPKK